MPSRRKENWGHGNRRASDPRVTLPRLYPWMVTSKSETHALEFLRDARDKDPKRQPPKLEKKTNAIEHGKYTRYPEDAPLDGHYDRSHGHSNPSKTRASVQTASYSSAVITSTETHPPDRSNLTEMDVMPYTHLSPTSLMRHGLEYTAPSLRALNARGGVIVRRSFEPRKF